MRNRYLIMGIGIGLIAGALLLQLMNVARDSAPKSLYTEEQVRQAADDLGLRVYDDSQEVYTEQEWKAKAEGDGSSAAPAAAPSSANPPSAPADPAKPSSPGSAAPPTVSQLPSSPGANAAGSQDQSQTSAAANGAAAAPELVKFKIAPGTKLATVAANLKAAGIIEDETAFVKQAKLKQLTRIIQPGTYMLAKGESFASVAAKITAK